MALPLLRLYVQATLLPKVRKETAMLSCQVGLHDWRELARMRDIDGGLKMRKRMCLRCERMEEYSGYNGCWI